MSKLSMSATVSCEDPAWRYIIEQTGESTFRVVEQQLVTSEWVERGKISLDRGESMYLARGIMRCACPATIEDRGD